MTRQEMLDKVYEVQGAWIAVMIGDSEERQEAWEEYVEGVEAMSDDDLLNEYNEAVSLESRLS